MNQLSKISVSGFRSIKQAEIPLRPLNVFIGANGAGKSNLIDFFRMLNYASSRGFQASYLADRGPASHILHFGPKRTQVINAELQFKGDRGDNFYRFSLAHVRQDDAFLFTSEEVQFQAVDHAAPTPPIPLGPGGHRESGLAEQWSSDNPTVRFIKASPCAQAPVASLKPALSVTSSNFQFPRLRNKRHWPVLLTTKISGRPSPS